MLRNIILIIITFFILSGCAAKPQVTVVRPDGGPSPNPFYVLQTLDNEKPIQLMFFYSSVDRVEDLDGSKQPSEVFLERRREYYFSSKEYPDLHTVLRIFNPRNKEYTVHYRMNATFSNGGQMDAHSEIARSDMKYREIKCPMPIIDGMKKVKYEVEISDKSGRVLIRTGQFKYSIN